MKKAAVTRQSVGAVKRSNRSLLLGLFGLVAILIAWGVRASVMAKRQAQVERVVRQQALIQNRARQIAQLRQAVARKPDDLAAHQALLTLYQKYGMQNEFVGELETVARLRPSDPQAQLALAAAYGALQLWPQAVARYNAIVQTWPDVAAGWQGLSVTFYRLKQYNRAMYTAERALRLQPQDPAARFGMAASTLEWAIASNRMGNHTPQMDSALQELNALLPQWSDKAGIHFLLGRAYYAEGKLDLAVQNLEEANRLQPGLPNVAAALAQSYLKQQRNPDAQKVVTQALAQHPDDAPLNELLGQLKQSVGEPDADAQALAQFQKAATLAPQEPQFQDRLGSACLKANNLDAARLAFEASIKLDATRPYPFQQLSVVYTRKGDKARAAKIAEAAREVEFNEQQLKRLQSLVLAHPDNVPLHLQLADRYRDIGRAAMAQDEYLAVRQLDPKNARALQGLKTLFPAKAPAGTK